MNQLSEMLRERVLDKKTFRELCDFAIAQAEYEAFQISPDTNYSKSIKLGLEILSYQNANTVFSSAQSPIETIFLNTLALCFIRNSMPLHMVADVPDVMLYVTELRKEIAQFRRLSSWYKEHCGDYDDILTYLQNEVRSGKMSQEHRRELVQWFLTYEWLNMGQKYHLIVQAGFPHIRVDGKSIRTDLFLWIPDKEEVRLVVECDGFQWHGNRDAFTADRKRDRALQDKSFQFMRFSGSEIYKDPAAVANELFKYLAKH